MIERTYTSEPVLRHPGQLIRTMLADAWRVRDLARYLLVRNLRGQHRQSLLGYTWIILQPLVTTAVWLGLVSSGVVNFGQSSVASYPLYVLVGTLLWQTFVEALGSPMAQMANARAMVTRVNFPREALLFAGVGELLVSVAARLLVIALALLALRAPMASSLVLAPVGFLALIGLGVGFGLALLPIGLLYMDVQRAIAVITAPWFLLTPVVWIVPASGSIALWAFVNPVAPLLVTGRELILTGTVTHPTAFFVASAAAALLLAAAWIGFRLSLPHVIARLSAR